MDVPTGVWLLTGLGIAGLPAFDFVFHVRKAHVPMTPDGAEDPSDLQR